MSGKNRKAKARDAAKKAAAAAGPAQEENPFKVKGNQAYMEKKYDEAIELYTKAIESDPKSATLFSIYGNRSAAFAAKKFFNEALSDADQALKLKPDYARGFFRRGQALEGLIRLPEAFADYEKGLKLDANDENLKSAADNLKAVLAEMKMSMDESQANGKAIPEKDRYDILIDWLKEGGAKFPYLYMQYYEEDYRGVHALTRIPNDKIILEVPLKLIMTSDLAKESDVGRKIISSGCKLRSTHSYLAAFLCQEKHKKNSFWQPYIKTLPQQYRNMPIFFDEDELRWLRGSFSLKKIADRKEDLLAEYENICRHVPDFKQYNYKEFVWARLAVITRIFGLVINGNKTDGLVPMADMLNHKRPRDSKGDNDDSHSETSWTFDDKRNGFTITSLKALNRGDQIFDSYGRKCNSRFFVNYGFSLDDNEDNQAVIPVQIPTNDAQYAMKLRFLGGHPSSMKRRFQIPIQYKEKETKEAFSFCRFAFAQDSEMMVLSSAEDFKIEDIEPISIRNETMVLKTLAESAAKQLTYFDTTIEEDNLILQDPKRKLTFNIRNAIIMRRGEKEVLRFYVELAEHCIPLLAKPWKDLKKIAAKCYSGKGKFDQYITMVVVPLVKAGGDR